MGRDEKIKQEAEALWRALFHESPPIEADGATLLEAIMRSLPDTGYQRLRTPHLRESNVVLPRVEATR